MWTVRSSILAILLLAACDGNPFESGGSGGGGGGGGGTTNGSVSTLPGTTSPTADSAIERRELKVTSAGTDYGNGFAEGLTYNSDDTFTVENLAFDGDNVYDRDGTVPTMPGTTVKVFAADSTYEDDVTGAVIDQFSHRALYGVSTSGRTKFAIVRTGAYMPFGFGGFVYSRSGSVVLPPGGQAHFAGDYAGLRDFDGQSGLQYVTGDMTLSIDFDAFWAGESATGSGDAIQGEVTNRRIFDLAGNDITANVVNAINLDKTSTLTELPTLIFATGPGNMDLNGEIEGNLGNTIATSSGVQAFEAGKFYAVISGANANQEVVGIIVVKSSVDNILIRETGGFILYR